MYTVTVGRSAAARLQARLPPLTSATAAAARTHRPGRGMHSSLVLTNATLRWRPSRRYGAARGRQMQETSHLGPAMPRAGLPAVPGAALP